MFKPGCYLRLAVISGIVVLVHAMAAAQVGHPIGPAGPQKDVFAAVQASLAEAADRTLAAALMDRRWMQTAATPLATNGSESASATDPVVRLRAAVERVRRLRPTIEPILRQEDVPIELSAIILVESGGIPTALSAKGARGVWQFMPNTARHYGLVVSAARDDRLDVTRSTHAAARYLRDLHEQFGDWQLAFAAYNAGGQTIERALGRVGQRDFPAIQRVLPQETRNYVPAVLQAIAKLRGDTNAVAKSVRDHGQLRGRVLYARAVEKD